MDIGDCTKQLRPPEQQQQKQQPGSAGGSGDAVSPSGGGAAAAATTGPVPLTALAATVAGCCLAGDAEGWLTCWCLRSGQLLKRVRAHRGRWAGAAAAAACSFTCGCCPSPLFCC